MSDILIEGVCFQFRPFACELCGKTWVKIGRLREHLKTHSTEKNELCDECGRAFKTRPELKDHKLEAHTDSKHVQISLKHIRIDVSCSRPCHSNNYLRI